MPRGVYQRKTDVGATGADETAAADAGVDDAQSAVDADGSTGDASDDIKAPAADEPAICPECFPNGWPEGVTSAGCIHGQWERAEDGS